MLLILLVLRVILQLAFNLHILMPGMTSFAIFLCCVGLRRGRVRSRRNNVAKVSVYPGLLVEMILIRLLCT